MKTHQIPCLLALLFTSAVTAQTLDLIQPYQRFEDARTLNDYVAAATFGRQALELVEAQHGENAIEIVDSLERLAETEALAGNFDGAAISYERALAIKERELDAGHPDLVGTLEALADIAIQQEDLLKAELLLKRVLEIERSLYGSRSETVITTLNRLRDLYVLQDRSEDVAIVDQEIAAAMFTERDFETTAESTGDRRYDAEDGYATVRVFYGTDRARTGEEKPTKFYGTKRGDVEMGHLDVSIPETHKYGELESQSRWSIYTYVLGEEAKKKRYVLLLNVEPLSEENFYTELQDHIEGSPSNDVFVFVHGYSNSFEDAARRVAQLAYDLDFDGTPMLYSWPSKGSTTAYTVDEAVVRQSGRKMSRFIEGVVERTGAERVHLIAHSMGNRTLIEALQAFQARRGPAGSQEVFDQVVFTAPDVDRGYFMEVIEDITKVAKRVTLYASSNDVALRTSKIVHGAPRAGQAGETIVTWSGLDTIDMSEVEADALGHSYFAANGGAIHDLFTLLWRSESPSKRCGMGKSEGGGSGFWKFSADNCQGSNVLRAAVLFKRFGSDARAKVQARIDAMTESESEEAKQEWRQILERLEGLLAVDEL